MPPTIETVDKLPAPLPHDRVNAAGKSNEEQDREAFKQMLRRRMGRGGDGEGEETETETLIVDIDLGQGRNQTAGEQEPPEADKTSAQDETAAAGDKEKSPTPPDHIDLKA